MIHETVQLFPDRPHCRLTTYITENPVEYPDRLHPAVIVNPGGAYVFTSRREGEAIALWFNSLGYQAFVLDYTLINSAENVWPSDVFHLPEADPATVWPWPSVELGKAMQFVRSHAAEWMIDSSQIGIAGFSAGGSNCLFYASFWNSDAIAVPLGIADRSVLAPAFCLAGYPFVDWKWHMDGPMQNYNEYMKASYQWMYLDYFGKIDPTDEEMVAASPNYHVNSDNPPTFLWSTATDGSVPIQHSIRMANALADAGVPFEYHIFGNGSHGLSLANEMTAANPEDVNTSVAEWTNLAETWLRQTIHFAL